MDLLAIAAADPTVLPLWAAFLFAFGMYPVGMFFGCNTCCGVPCSACTQGSLPDTLTVALSGIPETTPGPDLATLTFSSCYGGGASGSVTAPGQSAVGGNPADDRGPITAVSLTDGGGGYARLGRTAPTVTVTGTSHSGTGAAFDVTLAQSQDSCGLDLWAVSKVTITGGEGYIEGEELTFSIAEGDTQETAAIATIQFARVAPTVTVTGTSGSGSGATFDVTLAQSQGTDGRDQWAVSKVTMTGGTGYETFDTLTFGIAEGDTEDQAASAQLAIGRAAPTLTLPGNATGTVSMQPSGFGDGTYAVSAVTVTSGGSGYTDGEYLFFDKAADDVTVFNATAIARVNAQTGALESVELGQGGSYYKDDPDAREVFVIGGGVYYREDQNSKTVGVSNGGVYYREDASLPPYVADVTVTINQTSPSDGDGAVITAQVEDDTGSPDFGKVVGLAIENGGDGYLAHELFASCLGRFNGRSIVVKRNYPFWKVGQCCPFFPLSFSPEACTYGYVCANTGDPCSLEAEAVRVEYRGPNEPMTVFLMLHQRGQTNLPLGGDYYYPAAYGFLTAQENVQDCSDMNITAHGSQWIPPEATAVITSGGEYEETDACKRITEEDMSAVYAEVSWGDITASDSGRMCGWRSSVDVGGLTVDTTGSWCEEVKQQPGNQFVRCFELRGISSVELMIARNAINCEWGWPPGGQLCVTIERQVIPGANFGAMIRGCQWCYPVTAVTYDAETLLPSGIQLGPPTYYTLAVGLVPGGPFLTEAEVCQNPGTPTITFSSLP